MIVPVDYFLVW